MLTQPQSDLVAHFRAQLDRYDAAAGEARPDVVDPYAGQLLALDALVYAVPALWVDVETATLTAATEGGAHYATELTLELIVCALNQAGAGAQYAAGLSLASWALGALLDRPVEIDAQKLFPLGPVRFDRLATDETYYAARITADLELIP